jgi:hypothetical protein
MGFVMAKWEWGRFSQSTSVSPANSHYADSFTHIMNIIIYNPALAQEAK